MAVKDAASTDWNQSSGVGLVILNRVVRGSPEYISAWGVTH